MLGKGGELEVNFADRGSSRFEAIGGGGLGARLHREGDLLSKQPGAVGETLPIGERDIRPRAPEKGGATFLEVMALLPERGAFQIEWWCHGLQRTERSVAVTGGWGGIFPLILPREGIF